MELDEVAKFRQAFYRLVASDSSDAGLVEQGETTDEVADLFLTRGCRVAQRWMLKCGYDGWRKRTSALSWTGSDAANGGRYASLPSDFLRAYGSGRESCLVEANGNRWGTEIDTREAQLYGDYFYFRGDELWLARQAAPPGTVYLEYHYTHPKWESLDDSAIDFPVDARWLIVAEAANLAKEDNWFPLGQEAEYKIERALQRAKDEARDVARPSKQPRTFRRAIRFGNHW